MTQAPSPSSPTNQFLLESASLGLGSPSAIPGVDLVELSQGATEEQAGNSSLLGPTSSSLSKKHFEGDLTEDKAKESNILSEEPKWIAKGLLSIIDQEQIVRDEPISPDLILALGTPLFG